MNETIHLLYTNDLHSHFQQLPALEQWLIERRRVGDETIYLDIGDHLDRSHLLTESSLGQANVALLNELGVQYVTIGNNEGITLAHDDLQKLYTNRQFDVVVANLATATDECPTWCQPYALHETTTGRKIAFIGLTAPFEQLYRLLGWRVHNPDEALAKVLQQLPQVDAVVLLSHLGLPDDERLARKFPQLTAIIGGHTHHHLPEGKRIGNVLVCGAGKFGQFIGELTLSFADRVSVTTVTYELKNGVIDSPISEAIRQLERRYLPAMETEVVHLAAQLDHRLTGESPLSSLLSEAVHRFAKADVTMINVGLLLASLPEGRVTHEHVHRICPHPINIATMNVTGKQLIDIYRHADDERWTTFELKGYGFRGKYVGAFQFTNLVRRNNQFYVGEEPVRHHNVYKLAVPDCFTFGQLFPLISQLPHITYLLPQFVRDILRERLQQL